MKNIELNEEHKSKLLEMCRELFPQYTTIQFGQESNYYLDVEEILDFYNKEEYIKIHWFEFCMTHLAVKLKKLGIEINYWQMTLPSTHMSWWQYDFNHPVDYIYDLYSKKFKS